MTDTPRAAGVVPVVPHRLPDLTWSSPDELEWSDDGRERLEGGKIVLPSPSSWAWNAEHVAMAYWFGWTAGATEHMHGWFGGAHVSTVRFGKSGGTLYSASRWLTEPLESAEALAAFGEEVRRGCELLGLPKPKGSPGSVGAALLDVLAPRLKRPAHEVQEFAELAIYGGRNEAWRLGKIGRVSQWDRASAYAAHLRDPLPIARSEIFGRPSLRHDGISLADVEAPQGCCRIPVLPVHATLNEERRTVFPWGRFSGAWTHEELRAAADRGYRIRLRDGITWRSAPHPAYRLVADRVWSVRERWPLAKRVAVALVGRLHAGRVSRVVVPFLPRAGETLEELEARIGLDGAGWAILSRSPDRVHLALKLTEAAGYHPRANMPAAAVILARARLELLRVLEANADRLVSCATDGVILEGEAPPSGATLGADLGEWRLELQARGGLVRGPVAYELEGLDGARKVRVAGICRALASDFLRGNTVTWTERAGLLRRRVAGRWGPRKSSPHKAAVTGGRRQGRTPVVDVVGGLNRVIGWA